MAAFRALPTLAGVALVGGLALLVPSGAQAQIERGTSVGANFGVGIYANEEINDELDFIGVDEITSGFEYGASVRFPLSPRLALDLEVARLQGEVESDDETYEAEISALPLIGSLYISALRSEEADFDFFLGAGPLLSAKFEEEGEEAGVPFQNDDSKTGFYAHGGVEGRYFVADKVALTGRALGRLAKASGLFEDDLGGEGFDVDFNGAAFGLGVRFYFGGGGDEYGDYDD